MPKLIVATGNPGKLHEMQAYLTDPVWELTLKPEALDIEETGTTFLENAALKASQVAQAMGHWSIADDSGLEVTALNGAPGLFSARYGQTDRDRIARLLRELGDHSNRSAQFVCAIALAQPDGRIVLQTQGICLGEILTAPAGSGGFGYDPIFYVPEQGMTYAEMPPDIKHKISHRGRAFAKLLPQLEKIAL